MTLFGPEAIPGPFRVSLTFSSLDPDDLEGWALDWLLAEFENPARAEEATDEESVEFETLEATPSFDPDELLLFQEDNPGAVFTEIEEVEEVLLLLFEIPPRAFELDLYPVLEEDFRLE